MYQILVAEDEAAERAALCACLQKHFRGLCTVLTAESGTEAVELFARHRPQVVILTIEIHGLSGLEAARQIRQSAGECAMVFLSACGSFSHAREAIRLRAMDYLLKPWSEEELVRLVGEAIRLFKEHGNYPAGGLLTGECVLAGEEAHGSLRLEKVRDNIESYIRTHYDKELSMQAVAKAMNYSDAYFCKLFKQCFQVNFSVYLNEYRIARATELLRNTRLNIREVSTACGFSDANYFARVFKRITGLTPSEYREI